MLIKLFCWLLEELFSGAGIVRGSFGCVGAFLIESFPSHSLLCSRHSGGSIHRTAGCEADFYCKSCSSSLLAAYSCCSCSRTGSCLMLQLPSLGRWDRRKGSLQRSEKCLVGLARCVTMWTDEEHSIDSCRWPEGERNERSRAAFFSSSKLLDGHKWSPNHSMSSN